LSPTLAPSVRVAAQSVDYGALERLFGEPVTTSAAGWPQKVSAAPANMVIITQDDIRRSGANNIPDVLRFVAGLDVRRYGDGRRSWVHLCCVQPLCGTSNWTTTGK
jgi:outer membrane receptor for ferrienterochelin and colicins